MICDNQLRVIIRITRAAKICKFPITSFRDFTFPADNEFINSHATPVFLIRTNVFNRYSCLYDKNNCSHNDKDRFVKRKFTFHVNRNSFLAYPNVHDRFGSYRTTEKEHYATVFPLGIHERIEDNGAYGPNFVSLGNSPW